MQIDTQLVRYWIIAYKNTADLSSFYGKGINNVCEELLKVLMAYEEKEGELIAKERGE